MVGTWIEHCLSAVSCDSIVDTVLNYSKYSRAVLDRDFSLMFGYAVGFDCRALNKLMIDDGYQGRNYRCNSEIQHDEVIAVQPQRLPDSGSIVADVVIDYGGYVAEVIKCFV